MRLLESDMDWSNRVITEFNFPSPSQIPRPAAMMSNGDNTDHVDLAPVAQRIRKTVKMQRPRVARAGMAQLGKLVQEAKRSIEFVGKIIGSDIRAFADVPVDGGIGSHRIAKTDPHQFWQH